tara:strand:+ start:91 stop:345 length:255 start_codon:yes stop_codon:yes gene_type:complete
MKAQRIEAHCHEDFAMGSAHIAKITDRKLLIVVVVLLDQVTLCSKTVPRSSWVNSLLKHFQIWVESAYITTSLFCRNNNSAKKK